jgi:cellulose synthase/poly-beta-1,6-N-acetylglucosamine synthase-like glycosyltransferase
MEKFQTSVCERAGREVVIGFALLFVTMSAFLLFFVLNFVHRPTLLEQYLPGAGPERFFYNLIFAVFMFGSFVYQVSRLAFFLKVRSRVASTQKDLLAFGEKGADVPHVEILVPSYKEESCVIWQTLISAALVDYPHRGIVLLIDNPPDPSNLADRQLLDQARRQVVVVKEQFAALDAEFGAAAKEFAALDRSSIDLMQAAERASQLYDKAAAFLEEVASDVRDGKHGGSDDYTRKFFLDRIILEPANAHRERADQIREKTPSYRDLRNEFERLGYMFSFELSSFERKQYANLSQVATKASNLNSYISLMGRTLDVVDDGEHGRMLVEQNNALDTSIVPSIVSETISPRDSECIVILDADSFLLPNYLTCMVSALQSPGNERVAVMQTPYTTIPDTPNLIERAAGATTDIYYYVTEGMSFARAGSWIGAAAAIRKQALLDIVVYENERGHTIPIYIQDTTVIEDTGATIDLARRNWSVQNYPARLSYSATPPDFGALVVQRRRWSNGGLIILPNLLRYLVRLTPTPRNILEALLRFHYMIMPACISTSMLTMLVYPFDFRHVSSWIYLTLPPYLYLVCRDLAKTGYRRTDFFKAYTLFLILLPVVMSGVLNSILQIISGEKANFGRTPKVEHRTAAPAWIHLAIAGLFIWSIITGYNDLTTDKKLHAIFAGSNALALGYGIFVLIGIRATLQDIVLPVRTFAAYVAQKLKSTDGAPAVLVPILVDELSSDIVTSAMPAGLSDRASPAQTQKWMQTSSARSISVPAHLTSIHHAPKSDAGKRKSQLN